MLDGLEQPGNNASFSGSHRREFLRKPGIDRFERCDSAADTPQPASAARRFSDGYIVRRWHFSNRGSHEHQFGSGVDLGLGSLLVAWQRRGAVYVRGDCGFARSLDAHFNADVERLRQTKRADCRVYF